MTHQCLNIEALPIGGACVLRFKAHADERGHFARLWDSAALAEAGLPTAVVQMSCAFNTQAGTVRGLHFGWPPSREAKYVRCTRGRVHDVLLDLRPQSPSYLQHVGVDLSANDPATLLVPPGVAHGYQTLEDASELHYAMDEVYQPEWLGTVLFDDPQWGIRWPLPVTCMSERDRQAPTFDAQAHRRRWYSVGTAHAA